MTDRSDSDPSQDDFTYQADFDHKRRTSRERWIVFGILFVVILMMPLVIRFFIR